MGIRLGFTSNCCSLNVRRDLYFLHLNPSSLRAIWFGILFDGVDCSKPLLYCRLVNISLPCFFHQKSNADHIHQTHRSIRFWQRLREAFRQRVAALPSCNPYALVLVVDRNPHALHFRDRREEVLQKAEVIQRDHGKLGCKDGMWNYEHYEWIMGNWGAMMGFETMNIMNGIQKTVISFQCARIHAAW